MRTEDDECCVVVSDRGDRHSFFILFEHAVQHLYLPPYRNKQIKFNEEMRNKQFSASCLL
jgi:hypothetical protein